MCPRSLSLRWFEEGRDRGEKPVRYVEEWDGDDLAGEVETLERLVVVRHGGTLRCQHTETRSFIAVSQVPRSSKLPILERMFAKGSAGMTLHIISPRTGIEGERDFLIREHASRLTDELGRDRVTFALNFSHLTRFFPFG